MKSTALSVSGLTKRYGERAVVDHLDIELPSGVVAGFVGPNGAGKTTTMAMLLGLVRPTSGSATVLGASIEEPANYLSRVGAMIESPAFYPSLSGGDNLRMFATVGCHDSSSIPSLLDEVGLGGRGDDRYGTYSLGMKQRLGIAAALLGDPDLLILDEPANGLDPQGVREMRTLIGGLAGSGRTVLVSSHDLSELEQVCDWLILIDTGRSIYQGPARDFLDAAVGGLSIAPEYREQCRPLANVLETHGLRVHGHGDHLVVNVDGSPQVVAAQVNRLAFEAGIVLVELSVQRTTLEDRYLSLVAGGVQ
jgi:ABC-2 type transport system ATP-binding protein